MDTYMDITMIIAYHSRSMILLLELAKLCDGKPPKSLWGDVGLWTFIWTLP